MSLTKMKSLKDKLNCVKGETPKVEKTKVVQPKTNKSKNK